MGNQRYGLARNFSSLARAALLLTMLHATETRAVLLAPLEASSTNTLPATDAAALLRKLAELEAMQKQLRDELENLPPPDPAPESPAPPRTIPAPLNNRSLPRPAALVRNAPLEKPILPFPVYLDASDETPPYTFSGWMGDYDALELDEACADKPHQGSTCIRVDYIRTNGWAGIAWLSPENNWGDVPGGYDLTGAQKLTFYARGSGGSETVEFKIGISQEPNKPFRDSAHLTTGKIRLSKLWKRYSIPLRGINMSRVISGFVFVVEAGKEPARFYIDEIQYE